MKNLCCAHHKMDTISADCAGMELFNRTGCIQSQIKHLLLFVKILQSTVRQKFHLVSL